MHCPNPQTASAYLSIRLVAANQAGVLAVANATEKTALWAAGAAAEHLDGDNKIAWCWQKPKRGHN